MYDYRSEREREERESESGFLNNGQKRDFI